MSPARLMQRIDPGYKPTLWHLFASSVMLALVKKGKAQIILNAPPRHGKSRMTAIDLAIYLMVAFPGIKLMVCSWGIVLAEEHARKATSLINTENFKKFFAERLIIDKSNFFVLSNQSSYQCFGVEGGISGFGADVLILDDLHKGAQEANSETQRNRVWNWLESEALTRLSPNASVIHIGTRWHQDDVTGRLLKRCGRPWIHINLPAIAKDGDILNRKVGEALWPEVWTKESLLEIKQRSSRYFWSALYDGSPVPDTGGHVDINRFIHISREQVPQEYVGARWVRYWDLAVTEKKHADYTAAALCATDNEGKFYIIDIKRGNWNWATVRQSIVNTAVQERVTVGVEEVGLGAGLVQNLREVFPGDLCLETTTPDKDKLTRALPWFEMVNSGKCYLVDAPWNTDFLEECQSFPLGANDDQIDAVSGAYQMLNNFYMPAVFEGNSERYNSVISRRMQGMLG